jgi:hypothetical protein
MHVLLMLRIIFSCMQAHTQGGVLGVQTPPEIQEND